MPRLDRGIQSQAPVKPGDDGGRGCAKRDCGRAGTLRMFPVLEVRNWLVFCREAGDHVLVVRILPAKRDLPALFGEGP
jgi:hypothetical protein